MTASVFMTAVSLVVIATLLPLVRRDAWWIRSFDFPRLQILLTGVLIGVTWWGIEPPQTPVQWNMSALLLGALVLQTATLLPYSRLARPEVAMTDNPAPTENSISVMVANLTMSNRNSSGLLEIVRATSPDILLLLEPDSRWMNDLEALDSDYRNAVKIPMDNRYGMALYSKLELVEPKCAYLLKKEIPSIHSRVRLRSGTLIWLHGLHPEPPSPNEKDQSTEQDGELLLVGKKAARHGLPTIVAGDLNDVAWSYKTALFRKISGMLDPRIGRGMFSSFNAKSALLRWPVDHVFHTPDFLLQHLERLPDFGSDHFPVLVRLRLSPRAPVVQERLPADPADVRLIVKKLGAAVPLESLPNK